jgi:cysteinyl-tRNA synthetase
MAVLFDLAKIKTDESISLLKNLGAVMGLLQRDADEFMQGETSEALDVDAMILSAY